MEQKAFARRLISVISGSQDTSSIFVVVLRVEGGGALPFMWSTMLLSVCLDCSPGLSPVLAGTYQQVRLEVFGFSGESIMRDVIVVLNNVR